MFSSKSFTVSGLICRSLIHFEFIFVYDVRKCPNFILLHVAVQYSQHHLLKRLSLPHGIFLPSLGKSLFQSFSHFLIGLFVFLALSCLRCLYILEINLLLVVSFAIIFSQF